METDEAVYFNGVSGVDGGYLVQPVSVEELGSLLLDPRAVHSVDEHSDLTRARTLLEKQNDPQLGGPAGIPPEDFTQAGWGIVFASDESPQVKRALEPLIQLRSYQVVDKRARTLEYDGQDWRRWLSDHKVGTGSWEPWKIPLYLLVVGSPTKIPFSFTQPLSYEYFVGRIFFDTPDEYARYADSVVRYEQAERVRSSGITFFGTRHPSDPPTHLSADSLVRPLASAMGGEEGGEAENQLIIGGEATKERFRALLRMEPERAPAVLFTATHGIGFPADDERQAMLQGALLCADWEGQNHIGDDQYFSARDVSDDFNVHGLITFSFACYSAGTPEFDSFAHHKGEGVRRHSQHPFLAELPRRLLAHPAGGALAFVGHIDKTLGSSITLRDLGPHIRPFQNTLERLMSGLPLGFAIQDFRGRYAGALVSLAQLLQEETRGLKVDREEVVRQWLLRNDAEGYLVIGDPAVRIRQLPTREGAARTDHDLAVATESVGRTEGSASRAQVPEAQPLLHPTIVA